MTEQNKVPGDAGAVALQAGTVRARIDALCLAANTPGGDYFDAGASLMIATRELLALIGHPHELGTAPAEAAATVHGWKMVPQVPTLAMISAFDKGFNEDDDGESWEECYGQGLIAAIAAAPTPPDSSAEPSNNLVYWKGENIKTTARLVEIVLEECEKAWDDGNKNASQIEDSRADAAKPVGEVRFDGVRGWHMRAMKSWTAMGEGAKLYDHPQPATIRSAVALAEALERMDRARDIITGGNPRPECNWEILDTSDLRAKIELPAEPVSSAGLDAVSLEKAAKICDSVNNHDDPMTARDCADAIRALVTDVPAMSMVVAFREVAADGTPITDWIDGSLPKNTPPLHPGAMIQFAYSKPRLSNKNAPYGYVAESNDGHKTFFTEYPKAFDGAEWIGKVRVVTLFDSAPPTAAEVRREALDKESLVREQLAQRIMEWLAKNGKENTSTLLLYEAMKALKQSAPSQDREAS